MTDSLPTARVQFWTEHIERSRQLIEAREQYPLKTNTCVRL